MAVVRCRLQGWRKGKGKKESARGKPLFVVGTTDRRQRVARARAVTASSREALAWEEESR